MKTIVAKLISVFTLFLFTSCYNVEKNCVDFKTGKFEFTQEINGVKKTSTFIRTESLQIETFDGKTDSASVRWINDCEFILQKLNPKNMMEKKAISMRIFSTDKNSYTFEYSFVGDSNKQRGIATKID